jgi:hypothetical protein
MVDVDVDIDVDGVKAFAVVGVTLLPLGALFLDFALVEPALRRHGSTFPYVTKGLKVCAEEGD